MYEDVRDEWKLNEIERIAQQAMDKANEIDLLRSTVDGLERSNRELSAQVDDFRNELQAFKDGIAQAMQY